MTTKLPLTLCLAALLGAAAPALADHHAAKPDPQAATTAAKPKAQDPAAPAKETKAAPGATQAPQKPAAPKAAK